MVKKIISVTLILFWFSGLSEAQDNSPASDQVNDEILDIVFPEAMDELARKYSKIFASFGMLSECGDARRAAYVWRVVLPLQDYFDGIVRQKLRQQNVIGLIVTDYVEQAKLRYGAAMVGFAVMSRETAIQQRAQLPDHHDMLCTAAKATFTEFVESFGKAK